MKSILKPFRIIVDYVTLLIALYIINSEHYIAPKHDRSGGVFKYSMNGYSNHK